MATPISYGIGISDQNLQAMLNSDTPEIREQAEAYLAAAQNQQTQKKGILSKIGDFFFPPAASAEPDILNRKSVITGDFPQNQFPFRSMAEMAAENDLALNNMYTTPNIPFDANTFDDVTTSGKLPIVMSPKVNYLSSQNFPKIEFGGTVLEDDNTGITQSAAAQEFEPPYRIIGGQKVYLDDKLGIKAAEEKANFFTPKRTVPELTMDTIQKGIKTLTNYLPGMTLANMMDKFDSLPYLDRQFIKSRMEKVGTSGGDFYKDPKSGLFKDKAGLGIRSLRGNYAETINKEFDRYDGAVKRAENKYGVKWDGNQFVNADTGEVDENSELATKRNRRNIEMFKFFQNQKIERDNMRRAVIEKMKNQESAPVQKNFPITKTGDGGLSEAEKKAFAPRQDTFTKGKTVTLSDGRQYSSPR